MTHSDTLPSTLPSMLLLVTASLLGVLLGSLIGANEAAAYDVCSDPGSPCTHEIMTEEAKDLYLGQAGGTEIADEIESYWLKIKEGVGNLVAIYVEDGTAQGVRQLELKILCIVRIRIFDDGERAGEDDRLIRERAILIPNTTITHV